MNLIDAIEDKPIKSNVKVVKAKKKTTYQEWVYKKDTFTKKIKSTTKKNKLKPSQNLKRFATLCEGISKKTSFPCKNMTKNPSGYCYHH